MTRPDSRGVQQLAWKYIRFHHKDDVGVNAADFFLLVFDISCKQVEQSW